MYKIIFFSFAVLGLFLSSTLVAQVEKSAKETKVKAAKQIEKVTKEVKSAKDMVEAKSVKMKKECASDNTMSCCSTEVKEMKAEMIKGEKMMKKSHALECACEGCKMAKAEMKKLRAHGEDCTCEGCEKN